MDKDLIYETNKAAKCGEEITCPVCGKKLLKKQYSQAFCSTKCKDRFHNGKGDRHKKGYYKNYNFMIPKAKSTPKKESFTESQMYCGKCEHYIVRQGIFSDYRICEISNELKKPSNKCGCKNHFDLKLGF